MSSPILLVWIGIWMCVFSHSAIISVSTQIAEGTIFVDRETVIGRTDHDFICATLDWWPPEKCDYGTCSWGHASMLNLVSFPFYTLVFRLELHITGIFFMSKVGCL